MSVELHPGIGGLSPESLCYSLYRQLYQNFFNAQERKSEDHIYGIEEGDDTSIRLHNTAYGFAEAIAGSIAGEGSGGGDGILIDYLPKSGGNMNGPLGADYGFGAGIDNHRVLETFREAVTDNTGVVTGYDYGVRISGDLHVGGSNLYIGSMQPFVCDPSTQTVYLRVGTVDFTDASLHLRNELLLGESKENGIYMTADGLFFHGQEIYHGENANRDNVDWKMRNGMVAGDLKVAGHVEISGLFRALHGAELGADGKQLFSVTRDHLSCFADLSFSAGYGVRISGVTVLKGSGARDVRLEGAGGDLLLGGDHTNKVRLMSNLTDIDGEHVLVSNYGAAYFPDSLRVRHNYGNDLLSTYRVDSEDEGIVVHRKLRFGNTSGGYFTTSGGHLAYFSEAEFPVVSGGGREEVGTLFGHIPSISLYAAQNKRSSSFCISTTGDFIVCLNPVEASGHIGIAGTLTRLTRDGLFFTDDIHLQQIADGMRLSGNVYFDGSLSSRLFTSGMAGSGWAIRRSITTGSVAATFDELTIRKRMRVYELEVQRALATNGSLWVTDSCSGDSVEKL
nr:MAG TPA: hypothetical protein [Bacteriophage sp.]